MLETVLSGMFIQHNYIIITYKIFVKLKYYFKEDNNAASIYITLK